MKEKHVTGLEPETNRANAHDQTTELMRRIESSPLKTKFILLM